MLAFRSGLHRWFFRNKAIIVLFHRVDDRLNGDPLSVTTRQFRDYCEFFGTHFRVVTVGELLHKLEEHQDVSGHLVITFDDGYRDNFEVAAVELRKLRLPACFFVATNFIGSDHVPWWDAELPVRPQWMNWQQVRALRDQGFEIGSHTRNHVDLGVVSGEAALAEIVGSREQLQAELGGSVPLFSYPFGRITQITESNREAVRQAGYKCCFSAYGGAVAADTDPFRAKRMPIVPSWHDSPYQFGFEAFFVKP